MFGFRKLFKKAEEYAEYASEVVRTPHPSTLHSLTRELLLLFCARAPNLSSLDHHVDNHAAMPS